MNKTIIAFFIIFSAFAANAQSNKSKAYKTGIYVFCGKELPKHFSYLIEKKSNADTGWRAVAELKAPESEAACKGTMLTLPPSVASVTNIRDGQIKKIWQFIQKAQTLDSLYGYGTDPRFQFVAGTAWLDETANVKGTYQYRISKVEKNTPTVLNEERIEFPLNTYTGKLKLLKYIPGEANIHISYAVSDTLNTAGVKLYRSQFLQKNFIEIPSHVFFTREKNTAVAQVSDAGITDGVTYSYFAKSVDALGNEGPATDTINIYNLNKPSEIGLIQKFDVLPNEKEQGILLKWKLKTDKGIVSVDIYRSQSYEGGYTRLVSIPAKDTSYFDNKNIMPSKATYYYILINNGFGTALPSARVPVILKGNRQNLFPPQNLTVTKKGNLVNISFTRLEPDTRGYYIYRANSYTGALQQLPRMLLSTDSALIYTDTLPETNKPQTYSYAVADINTSYNISPITQRQSIQTSGSYFPTPNTIEALWRDGSVFINWKDVSALSPGITGYKLYRTVADDEGKESETLKIIAITGEANSFIDKNISEGTRYHYYVQSVGLDSSEVSSLSNTASVLIPEQIPMQPGKVSAFAADNKVLIKWDLPADTVVKKLRIYRAVAGQQAKLIKEMSANEKQFEDPSVELNKMYYYFITTVNAKNKESKPTDAVSAKVRG